MTNDNERKRPIKQFKVIKAYGPYRVGDVIQPTGMYRDVLSKRGLIEEVKENVQPVAPQRDVQPESNRMVPQPGTLFARKRSR